MKKRMRQTNRILSFLLFVLMLLSTAPVTVFAAGETCVCGFTPHKCFTSDLTVYILERGGYCDICKLFFIDPHSYDENGKCVCGRENLNGVCNDGILKADEDDKIQLKESWVVFPEAPVTDFDGKLSVSDELLWSLLAEYSNVFLLFLDSTDQHMRVYYNPLLLHNGSESGKCVNV